MWLGAWDAWPADLEKRILCLTHVWQKVVDLTTKAECLAAAVHHQGGDAKSAGDIGGGV